MVEQVQKPGLDEWAQVGEDLINRLSECVHVYKHGGDVFMSEADRQSNTDAAIKILQRVHSLLDQDDVAAEFNAPDPARDEQLIGGFEVVLREALRNLPKFSADMQKLLKSPWMKNFPSKVAETLFMGEGGDERRGLGSGLPEHGRLPGQIASLLEREEIGDARAARKITDEPRRHDVEGRVRWAEQNSGYLRTAGKIQ